MRPAGGGVIHVCTSNYLHIFWKATFLAWADGYTHSHTHTHTLTHTHTHSHTHTHTHTQERRDLASEMEERRRRERDIIGSSLTRGRAVMLTKFYFIDIQSLCEIRERAEARFQPCEMALVEFSLHSGITRSYRRFIEPGTVSLCGVNLS